MTMTAAPPPRLLTAEELAELHQRAEGHRKVLRLINSGPGGIAQIKTATRQHLTEIEARLQVDRDMRLAGRGWTPGG